MSKWPLTVFFDFDGVLVNSEPLHFRSFQEVLAAEKITITEEEYYDQIVGMDDKESFKRIFANHKRELEPKTLLRVMTRKGEAMMELIHRKQFAALPGVEEFVRGLWREIPLAICSGARREEIEAMLEGIALRDCFRTIIAAEDVTISKPDPLGYLLCCQWASEKLKRPVKPADCLVVEDAPSVIHRVRKAGFPVLAVASSYEHEQLSEANWIVNWLRCEEVKQKIPQLRILT